MLDVLILRVIPYIAVALVAFGGGWYFNGLRWEGTVHQIKATQARLLSDAIAHAQWKEGVLQDAAQRLRSVKDAEIRDVNARLSAALVELRNRPARPAPGADQVPGAGATPPGGTGASLFREDAEFLVREAARADEIRAALKQCTALYDEVTGDGRR